MIDCHMAVGVSGEGGPMIHCSKEETEALLARPGARPFEMRGREMKGWLRVDAESVCTKRALEPWAMQSVACVASPTRIPCTGAAAWRRAAVLTTSPEAIPSPSPGR